MTATRGDVVVVCHEARDIKFVLRPFHGYKVDGSGYKEGKEPEERLVRVVTAPCDMAVARLSGGYNDVR